MQWNVSKEFRGERQCGEASKDVVIDEYFQSVQTVLQCQLLQVQIIVLAHLVFQELATKIHNSPHLHIDINSFLQDFFTGFFTGFLMSLDITCFLYQ